MHDISKRCATSAHFARQVKTPTGPELGSVYTSAVGGVDRKGKRGSTGGRGADKVDLGAVFGGGRKRKRECTQGPGAKDATVVKKTCRGKVAAT